MPFSWPFPHRAKAGGKVIQAEDENAMKVEHTWKIHDLLTAKNGSMDQYVIEFQIILYFIEKKSRLFRRNL